MTEGRSVKFYVIVTTQINKIKDSCVRNMQCHKNDILNT